MRREGNFLYLTVNGPDMIIPAMLKGADLQLDRGVTEITNLEYIFIVFIVFGPFVIVIGALILLISHIHRVQVERHRIFAAIKDAPNVVLCTLAQRSTRLDYDEGIGAPFPMHVLSPPAICSQSALARSLVLRPCTNTFLSLPSPQRKRTNDRWR